jgi:hypothetical protein
MQVDVVRMKDGMKKIGRGSDKGGMGDQRILLGG